jgi:long-chain-fatty-acid--[acyl-carrier-protein] ligase
MVHVLRSLFWSVARLVLALRYRVRTRGLEQVRDLKGPVLILPNHPAYIDPPLVMSVLWPVLRPRPLIYEGVFRNPGYFPRPLNGLLIKLLDPLLVPDLNRPSARARARAEQAIAAVIDGLRKGQHQILWPAGHVQPDGVERLRAARALTEILKAVPEVTLVLVRTRGLWGSMFSYARTASRPPLMGRLWVALGWLLSNLFFFLPRRQVTISIEVVRRVQLLECEREKVNRWFEAWYNADCAGGPEKPTFVPYHFLFGPRTYEFPAASSSVATADLGRIKPQTRAEVTFLLERRLKRSLTEDELRPETQLHQLGLDSLDAMAVILDIEQQFGYYSEEPPLTVADLWLLAQGLVEQKPPKPAPEAWFRRRNQAGLPQIHGETLAEAFVHGALADRKAVAAADDQAGVVTYERLLAGTLTLARRLAELPAERVGLLLPASVACDTAFMALQLAGKVPVVLNWTTGTALLNQAVQSMGLKYVVTSDQFLDRTGVEVEGIDYVCLEGLRQGIGRLELLRTLQAVRFWPGRIRRRVPRMDPGREAMILFTSGSDKAPKAVPLTHRNLLSNQRACLDVLRLNRGDAVLGFLPAFHSFGLAVTSLLPLLAGIRVAHHPDPTAASTLARKTEAYQATILAGTPIFVNAILGRAKPEQLKSLRLICVGAEKCPEALMEKCRAAAPDALLLEGYGITECSPVVAVNRPAASRPGTVGRPLPGVEVRVVDPDTEEALPPHRMGELWVSGPSVFPGYLAYDEEQPFRERGGRRWYVTGDLAEIDADGFIRLCGRQKRFLKAGGEMISLPALEEPFARCYPPTAQGRRVAVEGIETEEGRYIVLFCTESLSLREANDLLHEEGFRGVMRLDEVCHVPQIPALGTGKVDYKALRALVRNRPAETGLRDAGSPAGARVSTGAGCRGAADTASRVAGRADGGRTRGIGS